MLLKFAKSTIFSIFLVFFLNFYAYAALETIWLADFDDDATHATSGSVYDSSGMQVDWWVTPDEPKNHLEVIGDAIRGKNLGGEGTWETSAISIDGYSNIKISINAWANGSFLGADDKISFYYSFDGIFSDPYRILSGNFGDIGDEPYVIEGLDELNSYDSLYIKIVAYNDDSSEKYYFDNVLVQGSPVPVPTSFLLLGSGIVGLIGFRRKNSI